MLNSYNIALDCIDKNAQSPHNKHKPALIYVKDLSPPLEKGDTGGFLDQKIPPDLPLQKGGSLEIKKFTFSNLEGLTNRIANALKNLGLQKGERLVLRLPNSPEFPITFLGAIKAGIIPIPSSVQATEDELKFILEDSEASVLVTTEELFPKEILKNSLPSLKYILCITPASLLPLLTKKGDGGRSVLRFQDLLKNSSSQFQTEPTQANDPAFWLYTSGTEGKPKAVIHAHRSIPAHDTRAKLWNDFRFNDVIFNTSTLNWSYALTAGLLDVWRHGLPTLIYNGPLNAEKICQLIKQFGITTFMSVPGIYRRLVEYFELNPSPPPLEIKGRIKVGFDGVRICNSAGEKLPEEIREKFKNYTELEIYEGLGMSEHSVYLVQRVGEEIVKGSCGKALPDQKIEIVDEEGKELPPHTPGILATHVSCTGLMLGYYRKNPPESPFTKGGNTSPPPFVKGGVEGFKNDYFLSGDLAQKDESGNFFFLGRRDEVITAGGYRISPLEVETVLNAMPEIEESAVIGKEIEAGKTLVTAFLVLKSDFEADENLEIQIKKECEKKLSAYKCPKQIYFVKSLPKTANGKLQRHKILEKQP